MEYFMKHFIEVCKMEFSKYGFKRKNNNFLRVENDVLQNFSLKRYRSGRDCTIEFGIAPLCMRIEKININHGIGIYNLRRFEPVDFLQWDHWTYNPNSEESMDACISEVVMHINKYLIPLFNKADSCKNGYMELCALDRLFCQNWLIGGNVITRGEDQKFNINGVNMLDSCKYYMALKNGKLNLAILHLKAFEQQNMDSYKSMLENGYLNDNARIRREEKIEELRREIKLIEERNDIYLVNLIQENEMYSKENLKGII